MAEGIRKRHTKGCGAREGGRCNCNGGYRAEVYLRLDGKKIRKTFARKSEAPRSVQLARPGVAVSFVDQFFDADFCSTFVVLAIVCSD